jgi:hypothetical protein
MSRVLDAVGRPIARYLDKPAPGYAPFTPSDPDALRQTLLPGDVLLVEGNARSSAIIKYLTQSTWSHSALHVGTKTPAQPPPERFVPKRAHAGPESITVALRIMVCRDRFETRRFGLPALARRVRSG